MKQSSVYYHSMVDSNCETSILNFNKGPYTNPKNNNFRLTIGWSEMGLHQL